MGLFAVDHEGRLTSPRNDRDDHDEHDAKNSGKLLIQHDKQTHLRLTPAKPDAESENDDGDEGEGGAERGVRMPVRRSWSMPCSSV